MSLQFVPSDTINDKHHCIKCIGPNIGLVPTRRQAIVRTNGGLGHCHIYASLGLSGLKNDMTKLKRVTIQG